MRSAISSRVSGGRPGHRFAQRLLEPLDQLAFHGGEQVRRARLQLGGDGLDLRAGVQEGVAQGGAFALPARRHAVQRLGERIGRGGAQRLGIAAGRFNDAGPAEHIGHRQALDSGHRLLDLGGKAGQLPERRGVECGFGRSDTPHDVDPALDLAAAEPTGDGLAQHRLEHAQFVGQAQGEVEEARVDGTQVERQLAQRGGARGAGEAGHARDGFHWGPEKGRAWVIVVFSRLY